MPRLVIDSNQANPIRFSFKALPARSRPTLVIRFRIMTELFVGSDADARRRALAKFPLMFGMDMPAIFDALAKRPEKDIRGFVPIFPRCSREHGIFLNSFEHPYPAQVKMAEEMRAHGANDRQRIMDNLQRAQGPG
jgi:hypothetical protein